MLTRVQSINATCPSTTATCTYRDITCDNAACRSPAPPKPKVPPKPSKLLRLQSPPQPGHITPAGDRVPVLGLAPVAAAGVGAEAAAVNGETAEDGDGGLAGVVCGGGPGGPPSDGDTGDTALGGEHSANG